MSHGSNTEIWSTLMFGVFLLRIHGFRGKGRYKKRYIYEYGLEFLTIQSEGIFGVCVCVCGGVGVGVCVCFL